MTGRVSAVAGLLVVALLPCAAVATGVPGIDEMASQWLDVSRIVHMPSLHNFHEMAACSPSLLGVNYWPGGQLYAGSGKRWYRYHTLPHCQLLIDGKTHEATTCRWLPYQAVRRVTIGGLEAETRVRMVFEGPGILYRVVLKNTSDAARPVDVAIRVPGRRVETRDGPVVVLRSARRRLWLAHAFPTKPDEVRAEAGGCLARWRLTLKSGEAAQLGLVMAHGEDAREWPKAVAQSLYSPRYHGGLVLDGVADWEHGWVSRPYGGGTRERPRDVWLRVEFQRERTVEAVRVSGDPRRVVAWQEKYQVQVPDGKGWRTVATAVSKRREPFVIRLEEPVRTRGLRLYFPAADLAKSADRGQDGIVRIDEAAFLPEAEAPASAESRVARAALGLARDFERAWDEARSRWARRWQQAFAAGNGHFSGHLPVLVTPDEKLREIYYRSILTLLALHRTNLAGCSRAFITSGERAKGVVYFWDTSMWATVFALLEPRGMKQHLRLFLQCDPHRGPVYFMHSGHQSGGWYAANDMTLFRLTHAYLSVNRDEAFLAERVGGRTVLEHLERLATNWRKLQRDKSVLLADYGENRNLLECAPMYVHRVASFNAANVWMMRTVAGLYERRANLEKARALRAEADRMAEAVLGLYVPGQGVWCALHRDGKRVELRHCYDFTCVGRFMTEDLPPQTKREMVAFVERELMTRHWMRAMSLRDRAARRSDRPDHGPMGAFDAWPALTAASMCRLGAWRSALEFVRRTQSALHEGVYAQARELYGPRRAEHDAPVRIAMRRGCMRECVGGGAFAELILATLFGYSPQLGRPLALYEPETPRGFEGRLLHLRHGSTRHTVVSGAAGLTIASE